MTRQRDDQAVVVIERSSGGAGAFFAGLAFGAGLALLLAPMSGEQARAEIATRARRLRERATEEFDELTDSLESGYERARASVEAGLDTARQRFDEGRHRAADAVEAGRAASKAAVRSARDELERKLSETRDEERAETGAEEA